MNVNIKITYWITTIITALYLLWSAYGYLFSKTMIEGIEKLGFPNFFRVELAVLKIIAVFILTIPQIPLQIKDWAYVGIGLFYLTALIAHFAHKDPIIINMINIILFGVLIISNIYLRKLTGII
ncbi:hypothetical protein MHTCC0001_12610 [Flavobacteriaceae bacterium MHTCC 0001]